MASVSTICRRHLALLAALLVLPALPVQATSPCRRLAPVTPPWARRARKVPSARALAVPRGLARRVAFWEEIWGRRGDDEIAIVDRRRPWVVHTWVRCKGLSEAACTARTRARLAEVRRRLERAWRRAPKTLARRLGSRALARSASWNLRLVRGRRDALDRALMRGDPHLAELEAIFAHERVPAPLARLAIVESLFQPGTRSHAGAVGAYQFVESTAAEHLFIRGGVDERHDPIRSGWAAARYLRRLQARFGRWDLAVTAYNAGPTRVARMLRRQHARTLARLVAHPSDPAFGFDAQNYYAQIVAVSRVSRRRALAPARPVPRHLRVGRPLTLARLARCVHRPRRALIEANPALGPAIRRGRRKIPRGYVLALPPRRGPKLALALRRH